MSVSTWNHALQETPQSVGLDCLLSGHGYWRRKFSSGRYFNNFVANMNPDCYIQT